MLIFIAVFWPFTGHAADSAIKNQLHIIAKSIKAAESQSDNIQKEIEKLNEEKNNLLQQLKIVQYDIARHASALHKLENSTDRLSFLMPESSYLDYHYRMRAYQTRKNILSNQIIDNYTIFADIENKQTAILNYIDERDSLSATINSLLTNANALNQDKETIQDTINTLSDKNLSLNQFLSTIIDMPYSNEIRNDLSFSPPASGIMHVHHNEMSITTAPGALITAPADGVIAYADSFGNLGNIVIINHGQGYVSVLRPFDTIVVKQGIIVSSGEPLGVAKINNPWEKDGNTSMLYYVLRYNEQSINPMTKFSGL